MAHNSRRRPIGNWVGVITPQDLDYLDTAQFKSLNADDGGTWNPSAWIMLGGSYGLRIGSTAAFECQGNGSILGNCTIGSTESNELSVNSNTRFEHDAEALGDLIAGGRFYNSGDCDFCSNSSNTFRVRGTGDFDENVTFDKQITVTGNANFNHVNVDTLTVLENFSVYTGNTTIGPSDAPTTCTINSTTTVAGNITINGDLTLDGHPTLTTTLTMGATSAIAYRVLATGEAAPVVSIANYDQVVCFSATTVYVQPWGANGTKIRCVNASSGTMNIRDSVTSSVLRALPAHTWIDLSRNDTSGYLGWLSLGEGTYVALG